jgi:hypothetical protein
VAIDAVTAATSAPGEPLRAAAAPQAESDTVAPEDQGPAPSPQYSPIAAGSADTLTALLPCSRTNAGTRVSAGFTPDQDRPTGLAASPPLPVVPGDEPPSQPGPLPLPIPVPIPAPVPAPVPQPSSTSSSTGVCAEHGGSSGSDPVYVLRHDEISMLTPPPGPRYAAGRRIHTSWPPDDPGVRPD